jgi:hypothetical protein
MMIGDQGSGISENNLCGLFSSARLPLCIVQLTQQKLFAFLQDRMSALHVVLTLSLSPDAGCSFIVTSNLFDQSETFAASSRFKCVLPRRT